MSFLTSNLSAEKYILQEMPHITLNKNTHIDLELEFHMQDTLSEFIDYIKSILDNEKESRQLANHLLTDSIMKTVILNEFDQNAYEIILKTIEMYT